MVYCGKPSGGCHACRERKTKCDQVPEGCTQCKRAKRKCPGYRVPGDLIFRNESSNVIRKFQAKEAREAKLFSAQASSPLQARNARLEKANVEKTALCSEDVDIEALQRNEVALSVFSLVPKLEDRATAFFVSNYVVGLGAKSRGYLDYLGDVTWAQHLDEGLLSSMKAVGLAGYAHAYGDPALMRNARYQYVRAIQSTNAALRHPVACKKDTTLLSIMVLGIFETITGCTTRSLRDWQQHIHGAAAVIKLRGRDQIYSPTGRRMLVHVTANMLISCIKLGVALPDHMREYMVAAFDFVETPDPVFLVQKCMMEFASLYASVIDGTIIDAHQIIAQALALDAILLDLATTVPPGWEYEIVYTRDDTHLVFNGRYHVYYDYWMAQTWNGLRSVRILLNELIRQVLLGGLAAKPHVISMAEDSAQLQISTDTLYALQADILYTVPQHMNHFPTPCRPPCADSPTSSSSPTASNCPRSPLFSHPEPTPKRNLSEPCDVSNLPLLAMQQEWAPVRMSGGSFLIWPLWFAGTMDIATDEVRAFVVENLNSIGETMGIMQAKVLAKSIKENADIKVWEVS